MKLRCSAVAMFAWRRGISAATRPRNSVWESRKTVYPYEPSLVQTAADEQPQRQYVDSLPNLLNNRGVSGIIVPDTTSCAY